MKAGDLIRELQKVPEDTQVCVYEDEAYWNIKPIIKVSRETKDTIPCGPEIEKQFLLLTGYDDM